MLVLSTVFFGAGFQRHDYIIIDVSVWHGVE
jgi:hypothetical protein